MFTDRNTRDHLAYTIGNEDPMQEVCIPNRISRTWIQQGWIKRNNSKAVVRHLEERNVGTKGKSPKQDLASAKDLTIGPKCIYINNSSGKPYNSIKY